MVEWVAENISTFILALILIAAIICIVAKMIRDKRQGKSSCGCGCSGCAMKNACHGEKPSKHSSTVK